MMLRSFLPIGQGAFYLEQFTLGTDKVNVVYDCGSSTDVEIVKKEIRYNFEKNEKIAAVFISHLDEDHINGIPFLLEYCQVQKVFFPLLTPKNQKLLLLSCLINKREDSFCYRFLRDPHEIEWHGATLYGVEEVGQEYYSNLNVQRVNSGENVSDIVFEGGSKELKALNWEYIPYNFREHSRITELKEALRKEFGKDLTLDELSSLVNKDWKRYHSKLKAAYKAITGDFNTNSMTLLSMTPLESYQFNASRYNQVFSCYALYCFENYCYPSGCLYTGDYDANGPYKMKDLNEAHIKYRRHIGLLQIPHHGSKHSYNHELLSLGEKAVFIVSSGEKNKYRHPHNSVIKDILASQKPFIWVTEHSGSIARFVVEW